MRAQTHGKDGFNRSQTGGRASAQMGEAKDAPRFLKQVSLDVPARACAQKHGIDQRHSHARTCARWDEAISACACLPYRSHERAAN
eukprot:2367977-Alexandrium_andersonii.AAC.2